MESRAGEDETRDHTAENWRERLAVMHSLDSSARAFSPGASGDGASGSCRGEGGWQESTGAGTTPWCFVPTELQRLPTDLFASGEARWLGVQPQGQPGRRRAQLRACPTH